MNILCDCQTCRAKCRRHLSRLADMETRIYGTSDLSGGDWKRCEHRPLVAGGQGRDDDSMGAAVWAIAICLVGAAIIAAIIIAGRC